MTIEDPDPHSLQLNEVQEWLKNEFEDSDEIGVFFDFSCLPQKPRSIKEDEVFKERLEKMDEIFSLSDIIFIPTSGSDQYVNSTWCMFEAFIGHRMKNISTKVNLDLSINQHDVNWIDNMISNTSVTNQSDKDSIRKMLLNIENDYVNWSEVKMNDEVKKLTLKKEYVTNFIIMHTYQNGERLSIMEDKDKDSLSADDINKITDIIRSMMPSPIESYQIPCNCFCKKIKYEDLLDELKNLEDIEFKLTDQYVTKTIMAKKVMVVPAKYYINKVPPSVKKMIISKYGSLEIFYSMGSLGLIFNDVFNIIKDDLSFRIIEKL
jgi:hypothetical protein